MWISSRLFQNSSRNFSEDYMRWWEGSDSDTAAVNQSWGLLTMGVSSRLDGDTDVPHPHRGDKCRMVGFLELTHLYTKQIYFFFKTILVCFLEGQSDYHVHWPVIFFHKLEVLLADLQIVGAQEADESECVDGMQCQSCCGSPPIVYRFFFCIAAVGIKM